jgi:hypothetical protein
LLARHARSVREIRLGRATPPQREENDDLAPDRDVRRDDVVETDPRHREKGAAREVGSQIAMIVDVEGRPVEKTKGRVVAILRGVGRSSRGRHAAREMRVSEQRHQAIAADDELALVAKLLLGLRQSRRAYQHGARRHCDCNQGPRHEQNLLWWSRGPRI